MFYFQIECRQQQQWGAIKPIVCRRTRLATRTLHPAAIFISTPGVTPGVHCEGVSVLRCLRVPALIGTGR